MVNCPIFSEYSAMKSCASIPMVSGKQRKYQKPESILRSSHCNIPNKHIYQSLLDCGSAFFEVNKIDLISAYANQLETLVLTET